MPSDDDELNIWVTGQSLRGQLGGRGVFVKKGARVGKFVRLTEYGNAQTGEIKKRELSFHSVPRRSSGLGYDFALAERGWYCEDEEIQKLVAFLHTDVAEAGRYRLVDTASPEADVLRLVREGLVGGELLAEALRQVGDLDGLAQAMAKSEAGLSVASAAVVAERRRVVNTLRDAVADRDATETDLHGLIGDNYWLFGGQYVGVADRRSLVMLDQYDIPLVMADGTLHVVELKGSCIPALVRFHRNHWIVGNPVHEAVAQAMSYLRGIDETGSSATIQLSDVDEHYKLRRVMATALIGSKHHLPREARGHADLALRTYNTHLSRVQVMTFDDFLDAAERALDFEIKSLSPPVPLPRSVDVREPVVQAPSQGQAPGAATSSASWDPWAGPIIDPWAVGSSEAAEDPPF